MTKVLSAICLAIMLSSVLVLASETPMQAIKGPIDKGLEILEDPAYQGPEKKGAQRDKMWAAIQPAFDFNQVSRRALARSWKSFQPDQQEAFVRVFTELLGNTYIRQIQESYGGEKVLYTGEDILTKTKVRVKTLIPRKSSQVQVTYSLIRTDQGWKVYDVNVEGVSLVKNYRTQFKDILARKSPAELIDLLEEKVAKLKGPK